ncbi:bifunctional ornithine acetyltransferase/N-acetylglutamate synthase [Methanothermobacter sp.]|uniref:bifunctional ornithine acetyltransferase/N-acetylglutamate synthase n=1 Tax=Methanothermobacter sp. TaxID=1884223 RepID=UPI00262C26E3|nr:bifunctional ornithine acetyltransferase/N-acetylglutamate synthase [Methanothermobacter sp.]MDI9615742.1 bifunctional ornithine acetyltransferase/N-acetylglutamate synthase [Methanothermobacter sp.]
MKIRFIEGGVCAVDGVLAAGCREGKYGVGLIVTRNATAAGVLTSNRVRAEPVKLTEKVLEGGIISAMVANSGNANCFTGKEGMDDALRMARVTAASLQVDAGEVAVASTGVIGRRMPIRKIESLIRRAADQLENSPEASGNLASAIMTTDTFPKEVAVEFQLEGGETARIGAVAKGSGMIAPNMATMLSFITTDVDASPSELREALRRAVDDTFNMLIVDGDESTNDMVIIASTCRSGRIDENFTEALVVVCRELARMMARDGEGATKSFQVDVVNARTREDARRAARAIAGSSLVKTAIFGADPNWGRIVAAAGYSGAEFDPDRIGVTLESESGSVGIVEEGNVLAFEGTPELELAERIMGDDEIRITVDLNAGSESATAYGCDLTYDYVRINAEYTT